MSSDILRLLLKCIAQALPGCLDDYLTLAGLVLWEYDAEDMASDGDTVYVTPEILSAEPGSYTNQEPVPVRFRLKSTQASFSLSSAALALSRPTTMQKYIEAAVGALTDPIEREVAALLDGFHTSPAGQDYNAFIEDADMTLFNNHAPHDGALQAIMTESQYGRLIDFYPDLDRTGLAGPFNTFMPSPEHESCMKAGAAFHRNAICLATRRPRAKSAVGVSGSVQHDGFYVTINVYPDQSGIGAECQFSVLYSVGILDPGLGVSIDLPIQTGTPAAA